VIAVTALMCVLSASEPSDRIATSRGLRAWDLEWSDAEDRLYGFLSPLDPIEGQSLDVSLRVGPFQGPEMEGPLTVTLRCGQWSQELLVPRAKDSKAYLATFIPQDSGECRVDVGWATTRRKLVHLIVHVEPKPLPRAPWYLAAGILAAIALALGVRAALRKPGAT
jgi:hypothetical protein